MISPVQLKKKSAASFISLACSLLLSLAAHGQAQTLAAKPDGNSPKKIKVLELLTHRAPAMPMDDLLKKSNELKNRQAWQELLTLLLPQEDHHAGDPAFDALMGLAAARTGKQTRAILAYERVLDLHPDNQIIRAELASAYFNTGENKLARDLFESLIQQPLPLEVQSHVAHYLRALRDRMKKSDNGLQMWTSLTAGHDSNINAGTDLETVQIPGFPAFSLPADHALRRKSSAMSSALLGVRWTQPIDASQTFVHGCKWLTEGSTQIVNYASWVAFSAQTLVLESALSCPLEGGAREWQAGVQAQNDWRDNKSQRTSWAMRGMHSWNLSGASQLNASIQSGETHYAQDPLLDGPRHTLRLGWIGKLGAREQWLMGSSVGVGRESTLNTQRNFQAAATTNWLGHLGYHLDHRTVVQLYASHEWRRNLTEDPVFLEHRRDRQLLLVGGVSWRPESYQETQWTASLSYQRNRSSIDLYNYSRLIPSIGWRAAF